MEHFQYGKQIGKILDIENQQKRHRAPTHMLLCLKSENMETRFHILRFLKKYLKFAHEMPVHNGCDALPNELMRFRIEAKPIWEKILKH